MDQWLKFMGRWHVLVIHFPVGLLVTALLVEIVAMCRRKRGPSTSAVVLTCCGAFGAVVAATFGWILAEGMKHPGSETLVEYHRWAGVTTAALSVIAAFIGVLSLRGQSALRWPFRISILLTAVAVIMAAHWGGELIYGEGYFWPEGETIEHSHHHDEPEAGEGHHHDESEEHGS